MEDKEYDLQVLLKLRKKERDKAETRYASVLEEHRQAQARVHRLEQEHNNLTQRRTRECREFDEHLVEQSCEIKEIHAFDRYIAGLRDAEEKAWQKVAKARQRLRQLRVKLDGAQQALGEALRQLKAVEKHYEKWQADQQVVVKRRQAAKMDEVASRIWRDRQR